MIIASILPQILYGVSIALAVLVVLLLPKRKFKLVSRLAIGVLIWIVLFVISYNIIENSKVRVIVLSDENNYPYEQEYEGTFSLPDMPENVIMGNYEPNNTYIYNATGRPVIIYKMQYADIGQMPDNPRDFSDVQTIKPDEYVIPKNMPDYFFYEPDFIETISSDDVGIRWILNYTDSVSTP